MIPTPLRHSRLRAFTLIELLVVIAIIAVLVAILLPAVQQAREAARASQCRNNLKQLALALHNYHETGGMFPSAVTWGTPTMAHHHTWVTRVLPFIDQAALFNKINMSASSWDNTGSPSNRSLVGSPVTGIRCPSEAGATDGSGGSKGVTITSYAACEGYDWWQRSPGGAGPENDGGIGKGGIFTANVWTRIAEIPDGTSNTILLGEATAPGYDGGPANTSGLGRPRVGDPLFRSALTAADWHGDTSYGKDHVTNAYRMRVDGSPGAGGGPLVQLRLGGRQPAVPLPAGLRGALRDQRQLAGSVQPARRRRRLRAGRWLGPLREPGRRLDDVEQPLQPRLA